MLQLIQWNIFRPNVPNEELLTQNNERFVGVFCLLIFLTEVLHAFLRLFIHIYKLFTVCLINHIFTA